MVFQRQLRGLGLRGEGLGFRVEGEGLSQALWDMAVKGSGSRVSGLGSTWRFRAGEKPSSMGHGS